MGKSSGKNRRIGIRRKLIQVYSALLYNANLSGFTKGQIFTGTTKSICVPGLNCYSCPGAVASCPLGSLQNALAASGSSIPRYIIGIILLLGLSLGRTICGWLCPFGLIQELLYKIRTPKLHKNRITRYLSYLKYFILAVFVIAIPLYYITSKTIVPAFCKFICPSGTLLGTIPLLTNPNNSALREGLGGLFALKLTILILILTGAIFIFRIFCRFLCPLGAIYGLFNRIAIIKIKVDENKCTNCGACISHCKMDCLHVGDHECISCGECSEICPVNAITKPLSRITATDSDSTSDNSCHRNRILRYALRASALLLLIAVNIYAIISSRTSDYDSFESSTSITVAEEEQTDYFGNPAALCPDFSICLNDGSAFTPAAVSGKYLIVNFWATWCGPCCSEMPEFERFALNHTDDVYVLAIHSAFITEDVDKWIEESGYKLNFAVDYDGACEKILNIGQTLPHTIIINPDGYIIYSSPGSLNYDRLEQIINYDFK